MKMIRRAAKNMLRLAYPILPLPRPARRLLALRCLLCGYQVEYLGSRYEQGLRGWEHWEALHQNTRADSDTPTSTQGEER